MKTHELKCDCEYFDLIVNNVKSFEIRINDREFHVLDILRLIETVFVDYSKDDRPTGRIIERRIIYMTDYQQKDGYVVLGLSAYPLNI